MSKRKFEELGNRITSSELQTSREESREQRKLDNILDYGKGVLSKALKVARGSERQKLGRRQKDVKEKKDDEGMARLGAEVAALKVKCRTDLQIRACADQQIPEYRSSLHSRTVPV